MLETNVIQRRDLHPLLSKASKIAQHFGKSANCTTAVVTGADCSNVEFCEHPKAAFFCSLCVEHSGQKPSSLPWDSSCAKVHRDAIKESRQLGKPCIYTCKLGFSHCTSPFFSGERYAGSLMAGWVIPTSREKIAAEILKAFNEKVQQKEIFEYLEKIPEKTEADMKALAQLLLLCAENLSSSKPRLQTEDKEPGKSENLSSKPKLNETERLLLACLRRGDSNEAQKLIQELLFEKHKDDSFDRVKIKAVELTVLLSRTGSNKANEDELLETTGQFVKRIENSKTTAELNEVLSLIIANLAEKTFSFQGMRHASALRKAERYIWDNYTKKLSLKEISTVSGLSAPYFSTIFKEEMGENLSSYLNRLRIEKSITLLRESDLTINKISAICGFEDQSWFSKVFKSFANISPYEFRRDGSRSEEVKQN